MKFNISGKDEFSLRLVSLKTLLVMKLIAVLVFLSALQVSARGYAQALTLKKHNATLEEVLSAIHQQTGYLFLYDTRALKGMNGIDVNVKNGTLQETLDQCTSKYSLGYLLRNKTILIFPKEATMEYLKPSREVAGTVTDSTGNPLSGVTVRIKNSNIGAITDRNGHFSIEVANNNTVLQISYLGFQTQEIIVGNESDLRITLHSSTNRLNQLVVVGYGVQEKATVTGAISTIDNKELTVTKNENVVNMLTGKVPGLRVVQLSSEPGSFNDNYDIRGFGSPLIVIDGVPSSGDALSRMDPNSISSISVLKDASAAIYGVRAANGVILVTTKSGANNPNGKFDINYSINQTWQQFLNVPQGVNAFQYMELANEQEQSTNFLNFFSPQAKPFSDSLIALYNNGKLKSTNWVKAITRSLAPETQHNLSVTGSNGKVSYYFNLGYLKQGSIFKTDAINYDRWNFRSNVNIRITQRLHARILLSGYADAKNQPGAGTSVWNIFKYAENLLPTDQIYANDNPAYLHVEPDNDNPVALTDPNIIGTSTYKNQNFEGQLDLDYDIPGIKGLTAKGLYNYGNNISDNNTINQAFNLYTYDPQDSIYIASLVKGPSTIQRAYYTSTNTLMQLSLNYQQQFGGAHNVSAMLLYEENHSTGNDFWAQRQFSLGIPYLFAGDATNQIGSMDPNSLYDYVTKSIVGRLNYNFKGRYMAEFTFRRDGSSRFSPKARWGFFPAVLAGWRISQEPFIQKLISPDILDNLKVRASYGKMGDDADVQYQWVSGYNYPGTGTILGGNYVNGLTSRGMTNDNLTWLQSKTFDIGVDFDLWNGLLGGSYDYFVRNRSGLLATVGAQLPGTVGENLPQQNLNSDQTEGVELLIYHKSTFGQIRYNVSANVSISRTMNKFVEETPASSAYDNYRNSQADRYTNIWWGYVYAGQFTSYNQIYNYPINTGAGNQSVLPGDYYYQDINHDGVIDSKDQMPIATQDLPLVNYGMTISANWKNFDVNVLLQGATDFFVQYAEQLATPLMYGRSALTQFMDRWHPADPNANVFDPSTVWVSGTYPITGHPEANGTMAVQNATYMRVKTLEIGYALPVKLLSRFGVQNLRIYVNSYNLATLTGLKNSDPEHPGVVAPGADWNYSQGGYLYPEDRTFSIGANVTF